MITVLAVPLAAGAGPVLDAARTVLATVAELRALRDEIPLTAEVDVLGDHALADLEGHRWRQLSESEHAVVLAPAGATFARVVRELRRVCTADTVAAIPEPPSLDVPAEA